MSLRQILLLFATLALPYGCVTDDSDDANAERTHYTLKEGAKTHYPKPLPDRTDIDVEWHYSNGKTTSADGFRGWDINGDDRFEMVEVLNDDGSTQSYVYDFDGDGRVDLVKDKDKLSVTGKQ